GNSQGSHERSCDAPSQGFRTRGLRCAVRVTRRRRTTRCPPLVSRYGTGSRAQGSNGRFPSASLHLSLLPQALLGAIPATEVSASPPSAAQHGPGFGVAILLSPSTRERLPSWTLASCPACDGRSVPLQRSAMTRDHTFACPACGGQIYLTDVFRLHEV